MKTGSVRFIIEGLSLEKLLNHCVANGIMLESVVRKTPRSICASIASRDYPLIREFARQQGWKISIGRITGLPSLRVFAWRRAALVCGILVFFALVWYMSNCIWSIEITNAGPYEGEVRQVLAQNGVNIGKFGPTIDIVALRSSLTARLTGLSWVSVAKDGMRLKVYCVQGTMERSSYTNENGDIVASRDGIIESVRVAHGTAVVKYGQAVKKGQILIKGEERAWNNATKRVVAQGEVLARVWYVAAVIIPSTEAITIPTGATQVRRTYITPWMQYSNDPVCDYSLFDCDTKTDQIGFILPIYLRTDTYEEITTSIQTRDEVELRLESSTAALRLAHTKAGLDKTIVDKWVEYSMMNSGICATATLEFIENIAGN